MRKRTSILRPASFLILATIALIVFIGVTGDSRRQANAIHRVQAFATQLQDRSGTSKRLPLNLSSRDKPPHETGLVAIEGLSSADAYILRTSSDMVLAAWTAPVVRAMGTDGRACIFFRDGAFSTRWLTISEFEREMVTQAVTIKELRQANAET